MKLSSSLASWPACILILVAFLVLFIPTILLSTWIHTTRKVEHNITSDSSDIQEGLISEIETIAKILVPINSSPGLARILSSSLNGTELSFSEVETKVAPSLFVALSTIPYLSQISYIGLDGIFLSYYNEGDQTHMMYSNTSFSSNETHSINMTKCSWYTQPVNHDTGNRYGEAIGLHPLVTLNESWIQEAFNHPNGYPSLGSGWKKDQGLLFLFTAAIDGRGVISLGFPVKALVQLFSNMNRDGRDLFLATTEGDILLQTRLPHTFMGFSNGSISVQVMKPNGDRRGNIGNISCKHYDDGVLSKPSVLNIQGTKYVLYCSPIKIAGIPSVYGLIFPFKGLLTLVHYNSKLAGMLLVIMLISVVIFGFFFVLIIFKAIYREMFLCNALIKQMEATQQAERKSMNKSLALANASHDMRNSLAAITGLIELCQNGVPPNTKLAMNLMQMNDCTVDTLRILNSILDTSKIEAGKMQLEEEEFDVSKLLEDIVDIYYPLSMKKGVDMVLDPYDGSIFKWPHVKGDQGKLKQILCNLLSNAVKFTPQGHILVRAWVRKPSLETSILVPNRSSMVRCLTRLFWKGDEAYKDFDNAFQQNQNSMEFVFEVDDTGNGIPKDKQKSVFENFVQVKEMAVGGTGLGLGIVQSLVRLMGGEIEIVDKEQDKRGTCFKFNVFLTSCERDMAANSEEEDDELIKDHITIDVHRHMGKNIFVPSPKSEGSEVILLIQGHERRRISENFIRCLGIRVEVLKHWEHLYRMLENIKHMMYLSHHSSSGKSEMSSLSDYNYQRKSGFPSTPSFILVVIDVDIVSFKEMYGFMAKFRRDLYNCQCKIVWIDNPTTPSIDLNDPKVNKLVAFDHVIYKPFHGSRLYQVIRFLLEFRDTMPGIAARSRKDTGAQVMKLSIDPLASTSQTHVFSESDDPSCHEKNFQLVAESETGNPSTTKPLYGKNILIVEDNTFLRLVAKSVVSQLGANVQSCENGQEAVDNVCMALRERDHRPSTFAILPYDYILMDCEMPIMGGYEATKHIRMEEKRYDVHIPIIALTGHTTTKEVEMTNLAGMDYCLTKPLEKDKLLDAIRSVNCMRQ